MEGWLRNSGLYNYTCDDCGIVRFDHDEKVMGHPWFSEKIRQVPWRHRIQTFDRESAGEYDAPMPPPPQRRRIREDAGLTQQQVADALYVSRHTIGRFERHAGYDGVRRLPGRVPSGQVRDSYSELLQRLVRGESIPT